jgi:ComF family protein
MVEPPFCARCGDPVEGAVAHAYVCSWCVDRAPHFDLARSAARYHGTLQAILQQFKYGAATHLRRDLAGLLQACVQTHYGREHFDAVAFVPLHHRKERERTYNQSRLLAGELARGLRLPVAWRCLVRSKATATQTRLSAADRAENVRNAFRVREPAWVEGRRLLLVDDVMTTGATVNECARMLKQAGAARVCVATVGRG